MTAHFTPAAFAFLRRLQRNNNREWFHAHKHTYERHVREPFQQLLIDLQPALQACLLYTSPSPRD